MTATTNIGVVLRGIADRLGKIRDRDYLLRPVAQETIANMKDRIHMQGKASDGSQIGTYSNGYMRTREENKRGKSTKIIVSLTRQLENDWSVRATDKGYGIGFNNPLNFDKAGWVEENKDKTIFALTEEEKNYVQDRLQELINNAFNS